MARLFLEEDIKRGRLALLYEEPNADAQMGHYLVTRKGYAVRPVAKAFAKWIRAMVKKS